MLRLLFGFLVPWTTFVYREGEKEEDERQKTWSQRLSSISAP